ncbi:MAG: arginase family protein [Planctomycetota bacterium]|jgi:arginase
MHLTVVSNPYIGERNAPSRAPGPSYVAETLDDVLERVGGPSTTRLSVELNGAESSQYGEWNRAATANGRLADIVSHQVRQGSFALGLLGNCTSLLGMLGGLQHAGSMPAPRRLGMVFLDAHADFNTPETTLSGMLGGMPVAVAAGLCLRNLRLKSGLEPPLPSEHVVMAGLRDVDPLEQELLDRSQVAVVPVDELRSDNGVLVERVRRLADITDAVYVHVDLDVLDAEEVPGHGTNVGGGPDSASLAATVKRLMLEPKVHALGMASVPGPEKDPDGRSRAAAHRIIQGALTGLAER